MNTNVKWLVKHESSHGTASKYLEEKNACCSELCMFPLPNRSVEPSCSIRCALSCLHTKMLKKPHYLRIMHITKRGI